MLNLPSSLPVLMKPEHWQTLDSTKLQCYCACPRQFFYEYVLGWRREYTSNHLIFGRAWHEALEHLYKTKFAPEEVPVAYEKFLANYRSELPESTDSWFKGKTPDNALLALVEYTKEWAEDAYEIDVLDTEVGGKVGIGQDREITVKLDLVGYRDGKIMALEHKTGSQAGETWANQWKLSIQIGAYLHSLMACYPCEGYDPTIFVNGTFFYAKSRKFLRVAMQRTGAAMLNWLTTVHTLFDQIEGDFAKLANCSDSDPVMDAFPMHPTACTSYAGCQFHDLCTCVSNPLRYVGEPITGYTEYWWDPLAEVKKNMETMDELWNKATAEGCQVFNP